MSRFTEGFRIAQRRDRRFILSLNLNSLDKLVRPLYAVFLCLDFLDVYSTLLALRSALGFHELNPIASTLFSLRFDGFLIAILFKYLPALPLLYLVYAKDKDGHHQFEIRLVRFTALVVLVAADTLLGFIVLWNNIPNLVGFRMH